MSAAASPDKPAHGIVLLAHGSRDPLWKAPVERVAALIEQLDPQAIVRCAYLELAAPDLDSAVHELMLAGLRSVRVVPMFLGVGKHLREDLPKLAQRLCERHPGLDIFVAPPIGEDGAILELIARRALLAP